MFVNVVNCDGVKSLIYFRYRGRQQASMVLVTMLGERYNTPWCVILLHTILGYIYPHHITSVQTHAYKCSPFPMNCPGIGRTLNNFQQNSTVPWAKTESKCYLLRKKKNKLESYLAEFRMSPFTLLRWICFLFFFDLLSSYLGLHGPIFGP